MPSSNSEHGAHADRRAPRGTRGDGRALDAGIVRYAVTAAGYHAHLEGGEAWLANSRHSIGVARRILDVLRQAQHERVLSRRFDEIPFVLSYYRQTSARGARMFLPIVSPPFVLSPSKDVGGRAFAWVAIAMEDRAMCELDDATRDGAIDTRDMPATVRAIFS